MNNYYCLVAGLPDLSLQEGKLSYSVTTFKELIYPELGSQDQKLVDLFYLQYDNVALLSLLSNREVQNLNGNYSVDELAALIDAIKHGETPLTKYPRYFYTYIEEYLKQKESGETDGILPQDKLASLYYQYAMQASNRFVAAWFEFNLNLNNLLAAFTARKYKLNPSLYILGNGEVSDALRTSSARDFGLTGVLESYEAVSRIAELTNLVERERRIDALKWEWLENESFFNYFTVERLFVFLIKISLIERWASLDKEKGSDKFREIIASLKEDVRIPDEFRK